MRKFKSCLAAGVAVASVISATPAVATQFTYVFSSHYPTDIATLTSVGGGSTFTGGLTSQVGSGTNSAGVSATVTAWNGTTASGTTTIQQAQLGEYIGGLGVTSAYDNYNGCGTGNCGMHQIDNVGSTPGSKSYDFVQLTFSKAVTLSAISRVAFGQVLGSSTVYDDDFSYGSGKTQAVLANTPGSTVGGLTTNTSMTGTAFGSMLGQSYNTAGQCSPFDYYGSNICYDPATVATNASADQYHASTVWWISASLLNPDNISDAFKLYDFTVVYNDAPVTIASVPEPASWTMMIGGFGLIGGALRRKKAQGRIAAA